MTDNPLVAELVLIANSDRGAAQAAATLRADDRAEPAVGTLIARAGAAAVRALALTDAEASMEGLVDLASRYPAAALLGCRPILALCDDPSLRSRAERAVAIATRMLREVDRSVAAAERAVAEGERAGSVSLVVRAQATLAVSLAFHGHGRSDEAWALLDGAARRARGADRAVVLTQRAGLLGMFGRKDDALAEYGRALPLARRADPGLVADLLVNRALTLAYDGQLGRARRDARRAWELFAAADSGAGMADTAQVLGFIEGQAGEIVASLRWFDHAEERYAELAYPDDRVLPDRAIVLIAAGRFDEAHRTAAQAGATLLEGRDEVSGSEALLLAARAALAAGRAGAALALADHAARLFAEHGRTGWSAIARLLVAEAELAATGAGPPVAPIEALTDELAGAGLATEARRARLVALRAAIRQRDGTAVTRLRPATRTGGRSGDLALLAWTVEAERRQFEGDRPATLRAAAQGMKVLDTTRDAIGSTELRAGVAAHARDLGAVGVRAALAGGTTASVLAWVERTRAQALQYAPVAGPDDPALARDLAEFRRVIADVAASVDDPAEQRRLQQRQTALERAIRHRARHRQAGRVARVQPTIESLRSALGDRTLVELFESDGELRAIVVDRHGARLSAASIDAGAVAREAEFVRADLRRALVGADDHHGRAQARERLVASAPRLDDLLMAPLDLAPGDLVISPPASLHALPWGALASLADRAMTVVPSAAVWLARATTRRRAARHGLFAAGPGLDEAAREVAELAPRGPGTTCLDPAQATTTAVLGGLARADLAHLACHCRLVADHPYFSSLELADGPLFVYDIERLRRAPDVVVLSACRSGVSTPTAGDELMGLSATLLMMGTRTLVGSVVAVPDAPATRRLMVAFHDALRAGRPPAVALRDARRVIPDVGAAFLAYGV